MHIEIEDRRGELLLKVTAAQLVLTGTLVIAAEASVPENSEHIVSNVVDITLDGEDDSQPDGDVELCFRVEQELSTGSLSNFVLASYSQDDSCWEKESDVKITRVRGETFLCGTTDHFTDFAILLADSEGEAAICSSSEEVVNLLLLILSCVSTAVALGTVVLIIFLATTNSAIDTLLTGEQSSAQRVEKFRQLHKVYVSLT